jgi:hypothetical protein
MQEMRVYLKSCNYITIDEEMGLNHDLDAADEYMKSEYGCIPHDNIYWSVVDPFKFTIFQLKYPQFIKRIETVQSPRP